MKIDVKILDKYFYAFAVTMICESAWDFAIKNVLMTLLLVP